MGRRGRPLTLALAMLAITMLAASGQAPIAAQIEGGHNFSAALSDFGQVLTWGANDVGQLGRTGPAIPPQVVPGLVDVVSISCGDWHTLALTSAGTVMVWGQNNFGQLGLGHNTIVRRPRLLPGVTGVIQVAAGTSHSLFLLANGTVLACGDANYAQLGQFLGYWGYSNVPLLVPGLSGVVAIDAGAYDSAALLAGGTIKMWGSNNHGQVGYPWFMGEIWSPTTIAGLSGITTVACGGPSTLALDAAGVVWQWGSTGVSWGAAPQIMPLAAPATAIAASHAAMAQMALLSSGAVNTWGIECSYTTLGAGAPVCTTGNPPFQPAGLASGMSAISFGGLHGLAMSQSGAVSSWGCNVSSQLGYLWAHSNGASPALIPGVDLTPFALHLSPVNGYTELHWTHGSPASNYANLFTTGAQFPYVSGLLSVGGLWVSVLDAHTWWALAQSGNPVATGSISASGTAVTTLPIPNSLLSGLTINAVSFNLGATGITHTSPVVTHTF